MSRYVALTAAVLVIAACGRSLPETRYYRLAASPAATHDSDLVMLLEPLTTDDSYNDERIVYRVSPHRLDYYDYHRWNASPGVLVGNYLEEALEEGGHVGAVRRDLASDVQVILGGRVVAIEEIDVSRQHWDGHIVLELQLSDARTGEVLWSEKFDETERLPVQTPEGLAQALSTAMARIVATAGPAIRLHAAGPRAVSRRRAR